MQLLRLCPDVLIHIVNNSWIFSNPRVRTHVELIAYKDFCFSALKEIKDEIFFLELFNGSKVIDKTQQFYGQNGLHADHTGIDFGNNKVLLEKDIISLLKKRWILVEENLENYYGYFTSLTSVLDREHIGTFHQRVGQYLTIEKRIKAERWKWWQNQKYSSDNRQVNEGPYKYIQESFFNKYFSKINLIGLKVLDFGCGNGYYSAKLAAFGANVVGIDTSKELIEVANSNFGKDCKFILVDPGENPSNLHNLFGEKFDVIIMQDVLLLLINPEDGKPVANLNILLESLHGLLKHSGKLHAMEPNPIFWLAGRYGDMNNPYAIITEYQHKVFNVVPTMTETIKTMSQAGFALVEYEHPTWDQDVDKFKMDKKYNNNFCIWDFMTFVPINKN